MGNQSKYYGCEVSLYHLLSLSCLFIFSCFRLHLRVKALVDCEIEISLGSVYSPFNRFQTPPLRALLCSIITQNHNKLHLSCISEMLIEHEVDQFSIPAWKTVSSEFSDALIQFAPLWTWYLHMVNKQTGVLNMKWFLKRMVSFEISPVNVG